MAEKKTTTKKKTTRSRSAKSTRPVTLKSFNPRTGEVMREIPANSPAEVGAAVAGARKVIEVGCGLGYSSLWLAHAAPDARVTTVERRPEHAHLARENFQQQGFADRITIIEGDESEVLRQ